jgi:hypothetical protein
VIIVIVLMTSTLGLGDPIGKMPIVGRSAGTTHVVVEETHVAEVAQWGDERRAAGTPTGGFLVGAPWLA